MAHHVLHAAVYERCLARSERGGLAGRRHRLLGQARGRVLEIGAGTGLNLAHYRPGLVSAVVALEPDGAMRRRLLPRLAAAAVPYRIDEAGVDEAVLEAGSFDTIVSTLVLCTVPDVDRAARSVARWLAPDGRLLFLEHAIGGRWRSRLQRAATPLWSRATAGCHLDRDVLGALRRAGLFVTDCERFSMPAGGALLAGCVQGVARHRRSDERPAPVAAS